MIGIYTLPKSRFSRWVETNDADTNLSEIDLNKADILKTIKIPE